LIPINQKVGVELKKAAADIGKRNQPLFSPTGNTRRRRVAQRRM